MAKYRRAITPEELEEQEELERAREAEEARQQEEEDKIIPQDPEEQTFKKRYGDLRSHSQRVENELKSKITELERQVQEAAKSQLELKEIASEDDAKAWANKYPELAKIFRYFAVNETKETESKLKQDIDKLNELRREAERQAAFAQLLKLHPDFEQIRMDPAFHAWVEERGGWVYEALYHNDTDAQKAADAITLYKSLHPKEPSKPEKKEKKSLGAAETVTRRSGSQAPSSGDGDVTWSESYIEEMSKKDKYFFDKHEDEIMEAIRKGKFVYDLQEGS